MQVRGPQGARLGLPGTRRPIRARWRAGAGALVVSGTLDIVARRELSEHLTSALPQSSLVAALTSLVHQQTGEASTAAPGNEGLR